ncbi:DUF2169 family type VI secretion system accessory protein [Aquella oligotrophica]|uniref:DUF2169 domain-containing protein n=1 Tax=Aquella oligotrophica TaxID=2067065 RepID=A0A2I7N9B8_9NEIS|nr:DUF2169 domain-containing protein [Aquella oligotrophica]AUR53058.1 hypothetical protein CUN60_12405 [Aquella oligotrophica]
MKTIKPNNMSLLFRTQLLNKQDILTIGAFATFSFNMNEPRLLEEQQLWKIVELNLGKDEILDLGLPKPRGEYLIYGKAYSSKPVQAMAIHITIDQLSKSLVVIGNRYWTPIGASKPEFFTELTVDYTNAYGGDGCAENPVGKGYKAPEAGKFYLPNIEDPNSPITRKGDQPHPAGFNAYPINWPQRMQYMGQIDNNYLQECWPEFPKGTDPLIFNSAPEDQQLKGYFQGTEKFTIKNMHPVNSTQTSKLPGVRARIFITQKNRNNEEVFKELPTKAETLWLFPNQEVGTLLFRANINVIDEEYSDLLQLYAVWESVEEAPRSAEFYLQQLLLNDQIENEAVAEPPIEEPPIAKESAPVEETVAEEYTLPQNPELDKALKDLQDIQKKLSDQLKAQGVDPEQQTAKIMSMSANPQSKEMSSEEALKELQQITQNIMQKNNLTQADLDKVITQSAESKLPPLSDLLKQLGPLEGNAAELVENLVKLDKISQDNQVAQEPEIAEESPIDNNGIDEATIPLPVLTPLTLTTSDVMTKYNRNKDLSSLDLSNFDLSSLDLKGADFSRSILNNVNFQNSNLDNVVFNNSFLDSADFSNTSLNDATINDSYLGRANFLNANLTSVKITNSDLNSSNFNKNILLGAQFTDVNLDQSNLENIVAQQSKFIRCIISNCNLSNANFTKATLTDSDLSLSILNNSKFNNASATGIKLAGATGESTDFKDANLSYSRADETTSLYKANFKNTNLNFASWEGAQLAESDFSNAIFDESNFSSSNFTKAKLELASAKKTNFTKAVFEHADLNRINLFKGSLRRSNLLATDLRYSNLYGVDFYKASMGQTDLTGANLEQTLLSAMGVSPKII